MPSHQSAVSTLIREVLADPDLAHDEVFRRLLQAGLQDLVDAEAAAVIGAQRYERTPERTNRRNGKRLKTVATTAGEVELAIPKLRTGSFFPSLLHPRRRVDKALYAVICQAWIEGVSTRKVDDLVKALGNESGISRSTVSRICKDIDEGVKEFLARSLDHTWFPYLFVDATYLDVRVGHRVVCRALVVATGVSAEGRREILGMALGDAETVDFWTSFLRSLRERGLKVPSPEDPTGVVLVTSDAHAGIRAAVRAILPGASWQRCRVHFARNITSRLGSARSKPVNALVSTIFAQTSQEAVAAQYKHVIDALRDPFPEIARMLIDAEPDLTAFAAFPREHWTKIWSNNPIERLNREIKRRADVVQVFPNSESVTRLIGSVLLEQHEEWQYGERRYLSQTSLRHLTDMLHTDNSTDGAGGRPALPPITT
ncbi:transposase [Actinomyces sp. oral taxon 414]|uniref:IS256 family transposase n=2 Tax=Actinomyces TaxID=1654 RepID=UPI0006ADB304|nr:IS256 family transposase [Actinomyces sp. oral taxon 414]ALC98665.1 transposase [Actinomyces sp. oral taxon 414]ALD00387.1 transposase [Actinomyces sp. oral taxon 414]